MERFFINMYRNSEDGYKAELATNSRGQAVQIVAAAPIYSECAGWAQQAEGLRVWQEYQKRESAYQSACDALNSDRFKALQETVRAGKRKGATAEAKAAAKAAAVDIDDLEQKHQDAKSWRDAWSTLAENLGAEKKAEDARANVPLMAFLTAYDFRARQGVHKFGDVRTGDGPKDTKWIERAAKDPDTIRDISAIRDYATRYRASVEAWDDLRRKLYKQAVRPAVDAIAARYCFGKPGFRANLKASTYDEAVSQCEPVTVTDGGEQVQKPRTDAECLIRVLKALMDSLTVKFSKTPTPDAHSTTAGNAAKDAQKTGKKTGKQKPKQEAPKAEAEEGGIRPKAAEAPKQTAEAGKQ